MTTLAALGRFELFARLHRRNLRMLMKHGVKIAIGTDQYRRTTDTETNYLRGLELFDNLTLLKMWCETTPQTIFPNRKIARLEEGYEASFLVLEMNPLDDLDHLDSIDMRFKRGSLLTLDFE